MLLVFIAFFVIIQNNFLKVQADKEDATAEQLQYIIKTEFQLAEQSNDGYSRVFTLPELLEGKEYSITFAPSEVVVTYALKEKPFFLLPNVTEYSLSTGPNRISKYHNIITVINSSGICGNNQVEQPNFYLQFEECEALDDTRCDVAGCNATTCFCVNPLY